MGGSPFLRQRECQSRPFFLKSHLKRGLVNDETASDSKCDTPSSDSCRTDIIKNHICFTKKPDSKCYPWVAKGFDAVKSTEPVWRLWGAEIQRGVLQQTMLQRTVFINKIRMLQRTQTPQRTNATNVVIINKIRMLQ